MGVTAELKKNTVGLQIDVESINTFERIGGVLAIITGIVHLYLYWETGFAPFLLAGLGFIGAVGLLFTTFSRRLLYAIGIPYIGIQILLWIAFGMQNLVLGVFDKSVQILLVGLLIALLLVELEIDFILEFSAWFDEDQRGDE
ncbi:hypothetical protein [Haladaptatus sp. DFWS20]|uniref:hypothetical protein n=1 Tax=Haladaptatus sp. DFWS20 TaxID=3403467 RepID=UPI003EB96046